MPLTVNVKAGPPVAAEFGFKLVSVGTGFGATMPTLTELEAPPPGAGLNTVILAVPALAISAAGICAVSWVLLTKVVVRSAPFQRTTELLMKFVPLTVNVNAAPPAVSELGLTLLMVGVGFVCVTVKLNALDAPPPPPPPAEAGLNTVTCAVPALAISAAVICAVSWVALPNVVLRSAPFQRTTELLMKFVPLSVNVNAAPPAKAELGLRLASVGAGFAGTVMVKLAAAEAPPPGAGLNTVICAVPVLAMSVAGICALNVVALPKVVERSAPFQRTVAPLTKFVPLTVRVKAAPPAAREFGFRLVMAGTGLVCALIVKVSAAVTPPPGRGLKTVTCAEPALAISLAGIAALNCVLP